jgi:hypothetical protein
MAVDLARLLPGRADENAQDEAEATYAAYERRNLLIAPLVRWTLTALLGWTYDGSVQARRRMVAVLPLVALRPAADPTGRPAQSSGPPAT